jgi:hypothetical protein
LILKMAALNVPTATTVRPILSFALTANEPAMAMLSA